MSREYLELYEFTNAFDYLKKTKLFLDNQNDEYWAKWVSLSLSDALYHFMLCALGYPDPREIIDYERLNKTKREILDSLPDNYTADEKYKYNTMRNSYISSGKGKVITFNKALDRIQERKYLHNLSIISSIVISSDEIDHAIKLRQSFRNYFQHYQKKIWDIELQYLKPLFRATISIIQKVFESKSLIGYRSNAEYDNLKVLIDDVKDKIEEI